MYSNIERQVGKPKCATCGNNHYREYQLCTRSCFGCGKDGHRVRYCSTRDGKHVHPNAPKDDTPWKNRFYPLQIRGAKPDEGYDDDGKFLYFFL